MLHNFDKIAKKIQEIEDFCEKDTESTYDQTYEVVQKKLTEVRFHAEEMKVPLILSAYDIVSKYKEEEYEEEESSYYEEESSYNDY